MHVCVVLMSGLGDVVHGLPVVNALKRANPATRVTWVVEPMPSGVLSPHPAVDEVIRFDRHEGAPALRKLWRDLRRGRRARGGRFDVVLNMNTYFKAAIPTVFAGAPLRIGIDRPRTRDPVWLFANRTIPPGPVKHTQDIFLDFLRVLEIPAEPLEWRLEPTPAEREEQRAFFTSLREEAPGKPVVSVVTASGNEKKDWTAEGYAAVTDALEHELGCRTMLVGGPGAREVALARATLERASAKPVWALGDGVRRVLWLLHGSDLVVAPDTGPLHMARAMDVPVVGLFGHTNPWRVGPYRRFDDVWVDHYNEPGDPPDASRADSRLGRMETIQPREVIEKVELALDRYVRPRRDAADRTPPASASAGADTPGTPAATPGRPAEVPPAWGSSGPGPGPAVPMRGDRE